jgi:hypothetical protein
MFLIKSVLLWHSLVLEWLTPRLAPLWAGVSPGIKLAVASSLSTAGAAVELSAASLSGAFVAISGSAISCLQNVNVRILEVVP